MLIPLGILASSGGAAGSYELIETVTLSSSQSSVTFSNLNNYNTTYQHLQVRLTARSNRTGSNGDYLKLTFNGDTGANYSRHSLFGESPNVIGSTNETNRNWIALERITGGDTTANAFGAMVIDILDPYETTKYTTTRSLGGWADYHIGLNSGNWRNTNALTSLTLTVGGGTSLLQYSRFSLYGLKGA